MSKIWFTSDLHFNHLNVNKFCNRPCNKDNLTKDEMNNYIFQQLNVIEDNDTVYHSGDFAMLNKNDTKTLKLLVNQLKGNWLFILGNHDIENNLREVCKGTKHKILGHYNEDLKYKGYRFVLCHYPMESWRNSYRGLTIMVHGHTHGSINHKQPKNRIDVGFDAQSFKPLTIDEVVGKVESNKELLTHHHIGQENGVQL